MEHEYIIVMDGGNSDYQLSRNLNDGWQIKSTTATQASVHYILERKLPEEQPDSWDALKDREQPGDDTKSAEDDSRIVRPLTPEDLADIPF